MARQIFNPKIDLILKRIARRDNKGWLQYRKAYYSMFDCIKEELLKLPTITKDTKVEDLEEYPKVF